MMTFLTFVFSSSTRRICSEVSKLSSNGEGVKRPFRDVEDLEGSHTVLQ